MTKNNLYTKSYFIKRLIETGYFVYRVVDRFDDSDIRYWMVYVRDRSNRIVVITCVKPDNDFYFRINGPNDSNIKLETLSMNVVIETIERLFKGVDKLNIQLEE